MKKEQIQVTKDPTTIYVYKEYLDLVPRMIDAQREELKESIRKYGLLHPLEVSRRNGRVVEGMTRFEICSELKIIPDYIFKDFNNDEEEKIYVVTVNLKRRQLNTFQQIELAQVLRRQLNAQNRIKTNQYVSKLKKGEAEKIDKKEQLQNTTGYKMAEIIGTGTTTIDKANYIIDHGTPSDLAEVRNGESSITHVYKRIMDRRSRMNVTRRPHRRYPPCPKCQRKTRFKGKCHVHKEYCCLSCDGGV